MTTKRCRRTHNLNLIVLVLLPLMLTACTITFVPGDAALRGTLRFGVEVGDVITHFEPTRGAGARYRPGDSISFVVRTTGDGYITLSSIGPDGAVAVLQRNIRVRGGIDNILPTRGNFIVGRDFGVKRVRAAFTPEPTDGRVTYRGIWGESDWTHSIKLDIQAFPVTDRDVRETSFVIVRPR